MQEKTNYNLALPFFNHFQRNPDKLALFADGREHSYRDVATLSQKISIWLQSSLKRRPQRIGILANRSVEAIAAIIGIGWAGGTYVPISLKLPEDRLIRLFEIAGLDALIVDPRGMELMTNPVLQHGPKLILAPSQIDTGAGRAVSVTTYDTLENVGFDHPPAEVSAEQLAYIIFTSGTTGTPKGVMIESSALRHHAETMRDMYDFVPEDRIAETADISFDLSVGNMFMTWQAGASLHIVPSGQMLAPHQFIKKQQLTVWYSVPSVIALMRQMNILQPGVFPSLRYSLFIGEPLPVTSAVAWGAAAPNSVVENLYGPTEATVACTRYIFDPASEKNNAMPTVSIGVAFRGMKAAIVDKDHAFLPPSTKGELALSGVQLASGYYADEDKTRAQFPMIDGTRWYLTGDLALQDEDGQFHHCGRVDHQVKVMGYRVELEDIEAHLRTVSNSDTVAAVAWPVENGSAAGIVGFVSGTLLDQTEMIQTLRTRLPKYMVPKTIHRLDAIPLSQNGKIDRKILLEMLNSDALKTK